MEMGEPPNDAPLPTFLQPDELAADAPAATAADSTTSDLPTAVARGPVEPRPVRIVGLPPPGPTGEAALAGLPITAITRRRIGWVGAALVTLWVLALFVRQVSDASAAQHRADDIRRDNDVLAAEVQALDAERELLQTPAYIAFEARAYGFGESRERRFVLAPGAPSLAPDAPGSAGLRVGRVAESSTPLESWLEILFGPAR